MSTVRAWACPGKDQPLVAHQYEAGPLGADEVEIAVEHCGICHSDLSVIDSEWGPAQYPVVPGHEVVGRVAALGANARGLEIGQRVGVGWLAGSCMHCLQCLGGEQQFCRQQQPTIIGHHGGFAEKVRSHWAWALPIPDAIEAAAAGPLLCGGVTVFSPLLSFGVKPTHRVGVVGIGGLGHMALKFCRAWGCEVIAFTSSDSKKDEALALGAHRALSSRDKAALKSVAGQLDFLLVTVNADMDWAGLLSTLAPNGRMHFVGMVMNPVGVSVGRLINGQRSVSGSPTGSRNDIATMLDFAARHGIAPQIERFPMSRVNDAIAHLREGKARYRVVLDADFA